MDKKQLFNIWAPREGYVWTKFAKPALFVHTEEARGGRVYEARIPSDIQKFLNNETAIIIDLPGDSGIETGLGLVKEGFRPVPLYNGIHEVKTGGLRSAVDNTAIIDGLVDGARSLEYASIPATATPAFLLDSNRDVKLTDTEGVYDNRWNVDLDDMPDAAYMKQQGISRVIVWTDREVQEDLIPIVNSYLEVGIAIVTYINGHIKIEKRSFSYIRDTLSGNDTATGFQVAPAMKEAVRKFENARFGLLLIVIMAAINLVGMFFINYEPLLWTAPSIMWLTYLWVSEMAGDVIAVTMTLIYFVLYLSSHKKRNFILIALVLFGLDTLIFFVYAHYYGIDAFTGYSLLYGLIVFSLPVIFFVLLIKGAVAHRELKQVSDAEYVAVLDDIDDYTEPGYHGGHFRPRRRVFRVYRGANFRRANYRGFGGYGGTGRGGYGGGGYGGFGG